MIRIRYEFMSNQCTIIFLARQIFCKLSYANIFIATMDREEWLFETLEVYKIFDIST